MVPHRLPALLALLGPLAAPGSARADAPKPTARLEYHVSPEAEGCPDEEAVRNAVSARLGYDPFSDGAARAVVVDISIDRRRQRAGLLAHLELREASGARAGSRDIGSAHRDCGELTSALTLAIAIAIDPLTLTRPSPPAPPPPPAACPPAQPCPPPLTCPSSPADAPAPPPAKTPVTFRGAVGLHLALGSAPAPAFGFTARGGARIGRAFSLSLEARGDLPAHALTDGDRGAETSLLLGQLLPCFHHLWLAGCAVVGAGVVRAQATGVSAPATRSGLMAVAGARLGAELRVVRWFAVGLWVEATSHLTPAVLRVDERVLWTMPALSGRFGLELAGDFS